MLVYKKTSRGDKRPAWKNNHFLRLSGMGDALLHKVEMRTDDSGIRRLHSGRIERIQREFASYEEAKKQELIPKLSVLQAALARDVRAYQALAPPGGCPGRGQAADLLGSEGGPPAPGTEHPAQRKAGRFGSIPCKEPLPARRDPGIVRQRTFAGAGLCEFGNCPVCKSRAFSNG